MAKQFIRVSTGLDHFPGLFQDSFSDDLAGTTDREQAHTLICPIINQCITPMPFSLRTYTKEKLRQVSQNKQLTGFPCFPWCVGTLLIGTFCISLLLLKLLTTSVTQGPFYIWDVYLQSHLRKDRGREKGIKNIMQKPFTYPLYQYVHEGERKQKTWTKTITSTHHEWLFVTALFYLIMFLHSWGNHEVKEEVRGFLCSHYLCW